MARIVRASTDDSTRQFRVADRGSHPSKTSGNEGNERIDSRDEGRRDVKTCDERRCATTKSKPAGGRTRLGGNDGRRCWPSESRPSLVFPRLTPITHSGHGAVRHS